MYPSDLEVALKSGSELECKSNDVVTITVSLALNEREIENDSSVSSLHFKPPRFPESKEISWWVLVGNPVDRSILAIKRISLPLSSLSRQLELDFSAPESSHDTSLSLKIYTLCDSFIACDQELDFSLLIRGNSTEI
jgi:pre-mRNA-splicing helicase BRR2